MIPVKNLYGDDGLAKDLGYRNEDPGSGSCTPDQNIIWQTVTTDTYGLAFVAGSTGFRQTTQKVHDVIFGDSWNAKLEAPWGTFTTSGIGAVAAVKSYLQINNCPGLNVDAACNASVGFASADWFVDIGAGPVLVGAASIGAQAYSFAGFDLRLNDHQAVPSMATFFSVPSGLEACAGSPATQPVWDKEPGLTCTSGTRWRHTAGPGAWQEWNIDFLGDPALPSIGCPCPVALPGGAGGTTSYNLTSIVQLSDKITVFDYGSGGTVTLLCPLGGSVTGFLWSVRRQFTFDSAYVASAVPDTFPITPTVQTVSALCGTIGSPTSSSTSTATPGRSLLAKSITSADGTKVCFVHTSGRCNAVVPPLTNDPPIPADTPWCGFTATRTDSWPVAPPCTQSTKAVAYDVSKFLRHTRLRQDAGTGTLWLGVSYNSLPSGFSDLDTGIMADKARMRFEDLGPKAPIGVLYPNVHDLVFVQTPNEGVSFGAPMTISSTLATGGFSDYDDGANGVKHFYWQEGSSAPYTIHYAAYDRQLNLIDGPVATNITDSDLAQIAVRESYLEGAWRMGIEYTASGSVVWKGAQDGKTFT